jgi:DNA-binding transcriptional LysR family regulator
MRAIACEHGSVELRDLEYFLACVEEGSVTRASRRVHVAQPTLSHALARLEREVGERLLERGPRAACRPTDAGRFLEARARAALSQVRAFDEDLAAVRGVVRGTLRIGSIQTLNVTLLPEPLARFVRAHPAIVLSVRTYRTGEVADAVRSGRIDVGLVAGLPVSAQPGLSTKLLYEEEFVLVVRSDDPLGRRRRIALREVSERPMLLAAPGTYTWEVVVDACRRAGCSPRVVLSLDSGEALRETVRAGLGLTLLPRSYVPSSDQSLRGIPILDPAPRRQVYALRSDVSSRAADAFVDTLADYVGKSMLRASR